MKQGKSKEQKIPPGRMTTYPAQPIKRKGSRSQAAEQLIEKSGNPMPRYT